MRSQWAVDLWQDRLSYSSGNREAVGRSICGIRDFENQMPGANGEKVFRVRFPRGACSAVVGETCRM